MALYASRKKPVLKAPPALRPAPKQKPGLAGILAGAFPAPPAVAPPPSPPPGSLHHVAPAWTPPPSPPPDPAYDQYVAGITKRRDTRLEGIEQSRTGAFLQYGYKQDPSTGAITFDATNPYSQAALLKRNYDQARTGNTNQFAARGQLYSGALQGAQNETRFKQGQGEDTLFKAFGAFLARNAQDKSDTEVDFSLGMGDALASRYDRIPSNPLYEPGGEIVSPEAAAAVQAAAPAELGEAAPRVSGGSAAQPRKKPVAKKKRTLYAAPKQAVGFRPAKPSSRSRRGR